MRRGAAGLVVAGVAIVVASAATIGFGIANAANDELTGRSVTDEQFSAIASAARSCPMLTTSRVAGQLMAESGLNGSATSTASGGKGLAGLDDEDWKNWAPWPDAKREDISATVLALAHQMCDLAGQVRLAGVQGDEWRLSLAAFRSGLPEVTAAKGVPGEADEYVDNATAYAAYYASLPQFGGTDGQVKPNPQDTAEVKPLPEEYVAPVKAAGQVCGEIPPATVAAVLMASSEFNPNKLGETGEQGVAQIRADVWARYGTEGASAWDAQTSIPAVGEALCGMITELNALEGDPYLLALAGYRNGPEAVRQSAGVPDGATQAFISAVTSYADYYKTDSRIAVAAKPSAPAAGSPSPKPAGTGTPQPTGPAPAPSSEKPKPPEGTTFTQVLGGLCISAGDPATVQSCDAMSVKQRWDVRDDGTIRSRADGSCLDVTDAKTENTTPVRTFGCNGTDAQRWRVEQGTVYSALADNLCLDVDVNDPVAGARVVIWFCVNNEKQSWVAKS